VLGYWVARFAGCLSDSIPVCTSFENYGYFCSSGIVHGFAVRAGKEYVFVLLFVGV
jgi:hypothetical protein